MSASRPDAPPLPRPVPAPAPAARPTGATLLAEQLRGEIVAGHIPPGSRLKLVPLARRFGVSRGPLREAASRLATEGLVTISDQRGFHVAPVSRADLDDVTTTRKRIEGLALADAIAAGGIEWEGRVLAAVHRLDRVTAHDGSPEARARFRTEHARFHRELLSACPSAYLRDFRARLYLLTERYRNLLPPGGPAAARDIRAEHLALAEAAVARDRDRAVRLLTAHLDATARALLAAHPSLFGA